MRKTLLVVLLSLASISANAEEHKKVAIFMDMFQPSYGRNHKAEWFLGGLHVNFLQRGRWSLLGAGFGLSSADPSGGFTVALSLADWRIKKSYSDEPNLYFGTKLIYDTHTHHKGVAIGFTLILNP